MPKPLIDPTILFQFATPISALDLAESEGDIDSWRLTHKHNVPHFSNLSDVPLHAQPQAAIAWSNEAMYFQLQIQTSSESTLQSMPVGTFTLWIDSRGSVGNKRLTKYCTQVILSFVANRAEVEFERVVGMENRMASPAGLNARCETVKDRLTLYCKIDATLLPGYQPKEFPQINYFYELHFKGFAAQPMSVGSQLKYEKDPSLWIRGVLV